MDGWMVRLIDGWLDGWMDGWTDCVAIKLGDKLQIATGMFNPLILKTRKNNNLFLSSSHAISHFLFFTRPSLPFSPPLLSKSIFLDPSVFTTPFSHSIVLPPYVSPLFFCSPLPRSRSGPLGKQITWITFITPREQKPPWSSWVHTHPHRNHHRSRFIHGGGGAISCSWSLWLACWEETPIKYCCELRANLMKLRYSEREGGRSQSD